jgi:diguanylate cyclase (GGDEF)-like protein/PAS domain S-box-containing protein
VNAIVNIREAPAVDWRDSEITMLRARLAEAEETLAALRSGAADALLGETGILFVSGAESTYVTFFSAMNEGGVTLDGDGTILYCNPRFVAMMNKPVDQLRGHSLLSCVTEPDRRHVAGFLAKEGADNCEVTLHSGYPVQLSLTHLSAGKCYFICIVVTDLTKRMDAEHELERLVEERAGELRLAASVFENTLEGVMITGMDGTILSVNPAFAEITGYSAAEAVGRTPSLLRSQRYEPEYYREFWQALRNDGRWLGEIWNRRKNGEAYLQRTTINLVPAQRGQPACYVAVFADATEVWHKDERITHLAHHDPLTDLPNRTLLLDRMAHAIKVAARDNHRMGVLFIDLDGFKAVNDSLGHHVGDQLLKDVAISLTACVRNSDTVSRIGGDEFVVLMESLENAEECSVLAEKLLLKLSLEAAAGDSKIRIGTSVGIAIYPDDGEDAATLLQRADVALYEAKAAGKGTFRYAGRSA